MRTFLKAAAIAAAVTAAPAFAQVAVADLEAAVAQSTAFQNAQNQIKTTYKTQMDAFNVRQTAISNQLKPLQTELQAMQRNSATPQATFQAKVTAYQTQESNAKAELQRLATPFGRPIAYAQQQVSEKLSDAIKAAMTAKGIKVIVSPDATLAVAPEANMTSDITAQLNTLVKAVSITPPANWQPGQPTTGAAPTPGR